jgi:hypothetical protein
MPMCYGQWRCRPMSCSSQQVGVGGEVGLGSLILEATPWIGSYATVRVRGSRLLDVNRVELGRFRSHTLSTVRSSVDGQDYIVA